MPIYAYKCDACGFAKDVLQKISDPLLTECPSCRNSSFAKQLTSAGFQLKGSGWYATDFRGSGATVAVPAEAEVASSVPDALPPTTQAAPVAATACAGACACHS